MAPLKRLLLPTGRRIRSNARRRERAGTNKLINTTDRFSATWHVLIYSSAAQGSTLIGNVELWDVVSFFCLTLPDN